MAVISPGKIVFLLGSYLEEKARVSPFPGKSLVLLQWSQLRFPRLLLKCSQDLARAEAQGSTHSDVGNEGRGEGWHLGSDALEADSQVHCRAL